MSDINISTQDKPAGVFKTYPEFSKLTLGDRKKYEALIKDYPPYADIAFFNLIVRWNPLNSCAVAQLNGNLVISYWLPGHDAVSGLCVVGTSDLDATVCQVFDRQKAQGEAPRLVHVPEFVIENLRHPELYSFSPERDNDEYIVPLDKFYPLQNNQFFRRQRIRKFMRLVGSERVTVKSLDFAEGDNRELLLRCVDGWKNRNIINNIASHVNEMIDVAIGDAEIIGTKNLCLCVDDEIQAFMLYHTPSDKRYVTLTHALVNNEFSYTYEYMVYAFARWFNEKGVLYVNLDADLDVPVLRMLKLALGPCNYFRKYTVKPLNADPVRHG